MRKKYALRPTIALLALSGIIVGLGFVPGSLVGAYAGPPCMCDCFNVTLIRDGRIVLYSSVHTPATLLGRYELSEDGSAEVHMAALRPDEPESLVFRIRPKFWFSILENVDDGTSEWIWKRPMSAGVERLIREQEIKVVTIPNEKEILSTFYDHRFQKLRVESKPIKKQRKQTS
jgi:hypothetical protein